MSIPASVIQKLDSYLGIQGRPYLTLGLNQEKDSGCMVWSRSPTSELEIWSSTSQDFKDAWCRCQEFLQQEDPGNDMTKLNKFFSKESPQIQSEWTEYKENIQKLYNENDESIKLPEASPAIKEAALRIDERINQEDFMHGDEFDFDGCLARAQELWEEESQELQEERAAFEQEFMKARSILLNTSRRNKLILKKVRDLLHDDSVIVYTNTIGCEKGFEPSSPSSFIVAPTTNQFDILRYENTNGGNYDLDTEDVIKQLMVLDEKFGIDIIGAGFDGVAFMLKRVPKGKEARELGKWLLEFCPDLYEAPRSFPKGKVVLWWD
jgi:hypothetical protein